MKIEIDTMNDNEEHIRHAIRLLQSLVQGKESFTNESASGATVPGLMNMFGESAAPADDAYEEEGESEELPNIMPQSSPEVSSASRYPNQYPDQSGFNSYGSQEATPRLPQKDEAPPGSLFGMFKDATLKRRDERILPY
ncbi:hypothetical protein J4410_01595 [Candidatus Woesearchaeota archaeon]|nr:hypothetical protein [Candidatus Woesearchaeota archaeon]